MVDPKALKIAPKPSRELAPGTVVDARYRVVRTLGSGGTAIVYEVEHAKTGRRLALKLLTDSSQAARLEQEAKAAAKLRSRHAVRVVDLGAHGQSPYLVMSFLEGTNLRELVTKQKTLDLPTGANIVLQVAECLTEAHALGLVHRDLKPENIHLRPLTDDVASPLFDVTVLDFGVVKMPYDDATTQLTRTGSTVGTPFYMSLEQLRGAQSVDAQSDVYSLSVLLYECFTGAVPFQAATLGDLVFAICSAPPVALKTVRPEIPQAVSDVVMAGLASSKNDRPKSMRAFAQAFAPYGDQAFSLWLRGTMATPSDTSDVDATRALDRDGVEKRIAERLQDKADPKAGGDKQTPSAPAVESPAIEPPKIGPPKIEPPTIGLPKIEPAKTEPPKTDPPTVLRPAPGPRVPVAPRLPGLPKPPPKAGEAPRIEPPKIGPPRIEAPRIEAPRIEAPRIEAPHAKGAAKPVEGQPSSALASSPIDEPSTTRDHLDEPERASSPRDRDTPTEMFVKDVHGRVRPPGLDSEEEIEAEPEVEGAQYPTMNLDAAPLDTSESTAVLQLPLGGPASPSRPFAAAPDEGGPISGDARLPSMSGAPAPTFGTPSQSFAAVGSQAGGSPAGGSQAVGSVSGAYPFAGYPAAPGFGPSSPRPGQAPVSGPSGSPAAGIDAFMARAGRSGNQLATQALVRFRTATPAQQALVVGIAAALGAIVLVTIVFVIFF